MNHRPSRLAAALAFVLAGGQPVLSLAQPAPEHRLSLGTEHQRLNNGLPSWREQTLTYTRQHGPREVTQAGLQHTRRFGLNDTQVLLSHTAPVTPQLTLGGELSWSPTHRVLARHMLGASMQYEFRPAWLLHTGVRQTRYDTARVSRATLGLEHYFGDNSMQLNWSPVRALGTRADVIEWRANHYYGRNSQVGLIVSRGDEATELGGGQVVLAPVRAVALLGRHALTDSWALTWAASHTRQGSFYTRKGVSLGLQHAF